MPAADWEPITLREDSPRRQSHCSSRACFLPAHQLSSQSRAGIILDVVESLLALAGSHRVSIHLRLPGMLGSRTGDLHVPGVVSGRDHAE